jgi:uncharacterized membrane protein
VDLLEVGAGWLHTLAFLIILGYYGILGRFIVPALEHSLDGPTAARTLLDIERRALPFVLLSTGIVVVSGAYLLISSPHYAGLANISASSWTTLMLLKHLLVAGLVGLGVVVDLLIRDLDGSADEPSRQAASRRIRLVADSTTGLGAAVILLTVVAQHA